MSFIGTLSSSETLSSIWNYVKHIYFLCKNKNKMNFCKPWLIHPEDDNKEIVLFHDIGQSQIEFLKWKNLDDIKGFAFTLDLPFIYDITTQTAIQEYEINDENQQTFLDVYFLELIHKYNNMGVRDYIYRIDEMMEYAKTHAENKKEINIVAIGITGIIILYYIIRCSSGTLSSSGTSSPSSTTIRLFTINTPWQGIDNYFLCIGKYNHIMLQDITKGSEFLDNFHSSCALLYDNIEIYSCTSKDKKTNATYFFPEEIIRENPNIQNIVLQDIYDFDELSNFF